MQFNSVLRKIFRLSKLIKNHQNRLEMFKEKIEKKNSLQNETVLEIWSFKINKNKNKLFLDVSATVFCHFQEFI